MVHTYEKMRRTNIHIKEFLIKEGYTNITLFPHTRWTKDVHIDNSSFDGVCTKEGMVSFFQCKSNEKPSERLIQEYRDVGKRYGCECLFLSKFDRKPVLLFK